jgi:cation diffusion facilitator CzcD-associated flavoprotein CzcO/acetyl esterase/lipase
MTPSPQADFLRALYQSWTERMAANPAMSVADMRDLFEEWHQATLEPDGVTYKAETIAGVHAIWALPLGADESKVILYLHGGGFVVGSAATHRKFAGHLAKHLGVTAVVIDYRCAPEHPFPAQIDDATAVYRALLARGFQPRDITTSGDSAGGNLAVSTVLKLRDEGVPLPGAVIAFSPWLDMEQKGKTLETNAATDALVSKTVLAGMTSMFLGEKGSRVDPLANPLKASYKGFPRLYIDVGTIETLLDNAQDLARIARADGAAVTLSEVEGMQHVFPFLAGRAIEADDELRRVAKWFRGELPEGECAPAAAAHGGSATNDERHLDAIVIGAGFGGMYMLHKLRDELGLKTRVFEKGGGVGGTWYFNRYPGAKSDTEGYLYRYSFDKDLLQEWNWMNHYLDQPEIENYLNHVADRYGLRRDIQLDTAVTSAVFDEQRSLWRIRTNTGEAFTSRYLVTALGMLAKTNMPAIRGIDSFAGTVTHTNAWPAGLDIAGKRVGVIGTGSTGTQFIIAAAKTAGHLTVFQRTPQYSVPSGNGPISQARVAEIKKNYDAIWDHVRHSMVGFGFEESRIETMTVSEAERQRVFQENWDKGNGFRFMFGTFSDIASSKEANAAAAAFVRSKIAEIVKDPETARKLTPTGLYAKRPLCNEGYYETFNRDNVTLVSIKEHPIECITPAGVRTADGVEYPLDVLVFATGFDAVDGNYRSMDLRGRGDRDINQYWADGPASYLGVSTYGFPNMFMILGPNGPFANLPPCIESQVEWISQAIGDAERAGAATIETTRMAQDGWTKTCQDIANATLFPQGDSWISGANIPGKQKTVMHYMGGIAAYRQQLENAKSAGYEGFVIR